MGDQANGFGTAGTALQQLFFLTPVGQRWAQATALIEGAQYRKRLEELAAAKLVRDQAAEQEQGVLTPYVLDPEKTLTDPFKGTFRFNKTAQDYAGLKEKGEAKVGRRAAAAALAPLPGRPALTTEDMGEVGTWPGALSVQPVGESYPKRSPILTGPTTSDAEAAYAALVQGISPEQRTDDAESRMLSIASRRPREVEFSQTSATPPRVDVLAPPAAPPTILQAAEDPRPPSFGEAYGRIPAGQREFAVPFLLEKAKAGLFKEDQTASRSAAVGAGIIDSFVTNLKAKAAELQQAGQPEAAAVHASIADTLASDADARKSQPAAASAVRFAQQTLGRMTGGGSDKDVQRELVALFGQKPIYSEDERRQAVQAVQQRAGWEIAAKQWGLNEEMLSVLRSDPRLLVAAPAEITPEKVAIAREQVLADKTKVAGASAGAIEEARLKVPNPMTEAPAKQWQGLTNAMGQLDVMHGLLGSGRVDLTKIAGGIRPWINRITQEGTLGPFPVPEAMLPTYTSEERQFLAAMQDYADQVLRQRSGAQINEQEFKRMLGFLASEQVRPEVVLDRLMQQDAKLEREMATLEHLIRSQRMLVPPRLPRQKGAPAPIKKPVKVDEVP